ncbi:MAG: hypothetical protein ACOX8X_02885 [Methanomethylophilus sp.]|jgi:hypothetical protein
MFKILGEETLYISIADTFSKRLLALTGEGEKEDRFRELFSKTEVRYQLNGQTEESDFLLRVPDDYKPEDIQLMADVILDTLKKFNAPAVVVDDTEQQYRIVISNSHEPEIIGLKKDKNMSSYEVFKPIFEGWDAPGRANPSMSRYYSDD